MSNAIAHVINNRYLLNRRREGIHIHGTECRHRYPTPTAHYVGGGIARGRLVGRTNRMSGWVPPEVTGPCPCVGCGGIMVGGQCSTCGFVTLCMHCGSVRVGREWTRVWTRPTRNASHGICPTCIREHHPEHADRILSRINEEASAS